jgi:hypothetical protein
MPASVQIKFVVSDQEGLAKLANLKKEVGSLSSSGGASFGFGKGFADASRGIEQSSELTRAFRESIHALHPALDTAGLKLSNLAGFARLASAGFQLVGAAIAGSLIVELQKLQDEAARAGKVLEDLAPAGQAGAISDRLGGLAQQLGTDKAGLSGPLAEILRGAWASGGNAVDVLGPFIKGMRADLVPGADAAKAAQEFFGGLALPGGKLTAESFASLDRAAPGFANKLAEQLLSGPHKKNTNIQDISGAELHSDEDRTEALHKRAERALLQYGLKPFHTPQETLAYNELQDASAEAQARLEQKRSDYNLQFGPKGGSASQQLQQGLLRNPDVNIGFGQVARALGQLAPQFDASFGKIAQQVPLLSDALDKLKSSLQSAFEDQSGPVELARAINSIAEGVTRLNAMVDELKGKWPGLASAIGGGDTTPIGQATTFALSGIRSIAGSFSSPSPPITLNDVRNGPPGPLPWVQQMMYPNITGQWDPRVGAEHPSQYHAPTVVRVEGEVSAPIELKIDGRTIAEAVGRFAVTRARGSTGTKQDAWQ